MGSYKACQYLYILGKNKNPKIRTQVFLAWQDSVHFIKNYVKNEIYILKIGSLKTRISCD